MKLANLDGRAGLVIADGTGTGTARRVGVVDVEAVSEGRYGPSLTSVFADWDAFREDVPSFPIADAVVQDPTPARLGPPSPEPRQVFGIGLNYRSHAEESGMEVPSVPATFTKFPTCIAGPYAEVPLPGKTVDWEAELVVVIGQEARDVAEAEGWSHVAGLTIGQDISERTMQFAAGAQFSLGKSYPAFGPTGPWLVTPDELDDPDDLGIGCSVDGETMQQAKTSDLIFSVSQLVAELSAVVTLLPGDLIFTGTPSGVGFTRQPSRFLQPGQVLETWIDGIGTLINDIVEKR